MQNDRGKPVAVAQREDMADEQRMIAALVPRRHFGGDARDRVREKRRVAGILVFRIDSFDRPAREMADQGFLPTGENVDAEMSGLQQERVHARFLADRHDAQWRLERAGHERIRRHAADFAAHLRGDDRYAGNERGHDAAEDGFRDGAVRSGVGCCKCCHRWMIRRAVGRGKECCPLIGISVRLVDVFAQRYQRVLINGLDVR